MGRSRKINMKFLVLAVICIAASTEAYSSGYSSGSASASTYASASSYASGGAAAASASAAAAPVKHYIEAEVKLTGMSAAEFNTEANKNNFKEAIADGMTGVSASDIYDVTAVDARRSKAVKVSFKVKVATAAAASSGASTLNTYLKASGGSGFLTKLKAKGGEFANVTAIAVTKAPAAKTTTTVSSVSKSAVVSLTSVLACAFLALRQ